MDIVAHNIEILSSLRSGTILNATSDGRIRVDGHSGGPSISCRWGAHNVVVNAIQKTLDTVVLNQVPLNVDSPRLNQWRSSLKKVANLVEPLLRQSSIPTAEMFHDLVYAPKVLEAKLALKQGIAPLAQSGSSSGTYIVYNRLKQKIAVFKPEDQELGKWYNPSWEIWISGATSDMFGIPPGTSHARERLAYLLDRGNFSNVPYTTSASLVHPTFDTSVLQLNRYNAWRGSFQEFQNSCRPLGTAIPQDEAVDLSKASLVRLLITRIIIWVLDFFSPRVVSTPAIQRLAIFDIRTLNSDRHLANVLIDTNGRIHPIDHGLILPERADRLRFDWSILTVSHWQFGREELDYIANLDHKADARLLAEHGIGPSAIKRMKIATKVLKACARQGFSPYQIKDLMVAGHYQSKPLSSTFFENSICKEIIAKGSKSRRVIDNAIRLYLQHKSRPFV